VLRPLVFECPWPCTYVSCFFSGIGPTADHEPNSSPVKISPATVAFRIFPENLFFPRPGENNYFARGGRFVAWPDNCEVDAVTLHRLHPRELRMLRRSCASFLKRLPGRGLPWG
jgi:hypothetical protein